MQIKLFLLSSFLTAASATGICDSGLYQALKPLSTYTPAQAYCAQRFPPKTVTVTQASIAPREQFDRRATTTTTIAQAKNVSTSSKSTSTTTRMTTTSKGRDSKELMWSSLSSKAGGVLSTLCSCIQSTKTVSSLESVG